jgi:hypothetical protein
MNISEKCKVSGPGFFPFGEKHITMKKENEWGNHEKRGD